MAGTLKFNPPPGWPAPPPEWVPPPGWQPDRSWPPAPDGWQFWIPQPRKSSRKLVVTLAVVGLAVVGLLVTSLVVASQPSSEQQATPPHIYGFAHTCVVTRSGGVACWGLNTWGQLGDGTTTDSPIPVAVHGLPSGIVSVSSNAGHSCAVTTAGAMWCWGRNDSGQLGDGTLTDRARPVQVQGLDRAQSVATGGAHTCAVTSAGQVACWGRNADGQLGDGTNLNRPTPVTVTGLAARTVVTGVYHTCALTPGGTVKCWGNNGGGAIGTGGTPDEDRNTPTDVAELGDDVVAIAAGVEHTCAATSGGAVKCWGMNNNGQLGNGSTSASGTPVTVSSRTQVVALAAGNSHTCALSRDGALTCWGANGYGQLGDAANADRLAPTDVASAPTDIGSIVAIGEHTCAITTPGDVWCWGWNKYGQLGTGTTTDASTPTPVQALP